MAVALGGAIAACGGPQNTLNGKSPGQIVATATATAVRFGGVHYNVQSTGSAPEPNGTGDAGVNAGDEILTSGSDKVALLYVKPDVFVRGNVGGLEDILALDFQDDTSSWTLDSDGKWRRVQQIREVHAQRRFEELARERSRRRRGADGAA